MVWQTLQNNPGMTIQQVLEDDRQSRTALFDYLAEEVLAGQTPERQDFLLATSILSKLDSSTCDFLLMIDTSDKILMDLHSSGLFIEELRPASIAIIRFSANFCSTGSNRTPGGWWTCTARLPAISMPMSIGKRR